MLSVCAGLTVGYFSSAISDIWLVFVCMSLDISVKLTAALTPAVVCLYMPLYVVYQILCVSVNLINAALFPIWDCDYWLSSSKTGGDRLGLGLTLFYLAMLTLSVYTFGSFHAEHHKANSFSHTRFTDWRMNCTSWSWDCVPDQIRKFFLKAHWWDQSRMCFVEQQLYANILVHTQ